MKINNLGNSIPTSVHELVFMAIPPKLFSPHAPPPRTRLRTSLPHILCLFFNLSFALLSFNAAVQSKAQAGMDLWPRNSTVVQGGARQFGAYVPISPNTIVWLVNEIPGGNNSVGTISASGLYQSPSPAPIENTVVIKAQSTVLPNNFASTPLTIIRPYPWLWSVYPSNLAVGNYSVTFNGANFTVDSQAQANGVDLQTIYVSPTKLVAVGTASTPGAIQFTVRQPSPGAITGNSFTANVIQPSVTVVVSPPFATVQLGESTTFSATVSGSGNPSVTWSVIGGSTNGGIDSSGHYSAPVSMPPTPDVVLRATSVSDPLAFAQATVHLIPAPVTVLVSPTSTTLSIGDTAQFQATVLGTLNTAVSWSVVGGNLNGTIGINGLFQSPGTLPSDPSIKVRATSLADPTAYGETQITLTPVINYSSLLAAGRFLEQSSFGPSPTTISLVQQIGIEPFLDQQFALPPTSIPVPSNNSIHSLRQWQLHHFSVAPDQLRQRVAFALGQILVVSANKLIYADAILPWMNILNQNAFGNYRELLKQITLSPSMGKYLDLANSTKPSLNGGANENYPRELMQLFTIGPWALNHDGSYLQDSNGFQVLTYSQNTVAQVALALTGWTYATAPGATPQNQNWEYFGAPLESRAVNHDFSSKSILGCSFPAGQSVEQVLEDLLDCLMNHPNIAPFIATRLIRSLVISNPSPGYIDRIASVFDDNGNGVKGDLQAVVRAILLDPEARNDQASVHSGRLKDPIVNIVGLLRALGGQFTPTHQLTYLFEYMAQGPLNPPSVFSWFSPLYRVPKSPLYGPEFQIYSPTEATLRGNFFFNLLHYPGGDLIVDLSPFQPYGNDLPGLVEAVNQRLLYGRMPTAMKQVLINAASPGYNAQTQIETVLYLTALSGHYTVQY